MTYSQSLMQKAIPRLALAVSPFLLAACLGSTQSAGARLEAPPPSLTQPAQPPVTLPARDITQAEVERFWRADRARLIEAREKHQGLVDWAAGVVAALSD